MKVRLVWLVAGFAVFALLGYWLAKSAAPPVAREVTSAAVELPAPARVVDEPPVKFRRAGRPPRARGDAAAAALGAVEGERIVAFRDAAALAAFLRRAGDSVRVLDRLDALHALRVGFEDPDDLAGLLDGEEEWFIYPVNAPPPPEGTVQSGAVALGDKLHQWLGIVGDNSQWGKGVTVAVLDTGVESHPAFAASIRSIDLVEAGATRNGHGTAVASVIIGGDPRTPGVAPGADLISVAVADATGQSDSFLLAKGIIAAVDAGADLVNISMGSLGDSGLVRKAIEYAGERGVLIVAAAGNNGIGQVAYPAANQGVIAVGAVDALGAHLDFSNRGDEIDIAAPGFGVQAAWTGEQAASVTGTSFSAPIVTGALAAVMTEAGGETTLTARQAWERLAARLNDGGVAGRDPLLGAGMPDIGRVLEAGTPGIHDAALASNRIVPPTAGTPFGEVEVLVQNRGTETLINTAVEVSTGGGTVTSNITTLAPNAVATVRVPVSRPPSEQAGALRVDSKVVLSGNVRDVRPHNDRRTETYVAAPSP